MADGSLLSPDFLRRLAGLRLAVRRRFRGGSVGTRRSRRRGSSVEFADHRPYAPGDDIRRIDWKAYARLEALVLRLYVAEEDVSVYLLVDTSRSHAFGEPSKLEVGKRIAAGIGYLGLTGSERVHVCPFADGLSEVVPVGRGKRRVGTLLRTLDALEPAGGTDLARAVDRFLVRRPRPGLVFLVSDLLDPGGFERPLSRLLAERHEVIVFHVLAREELAPPRGGDLSLVDSETGERVDVSLDARALAAYRRRMRTFLEGAEAFAKKRGIAYVRIDDARTFEDALLDYLRVG